MEGGPVDIKEKVGKFADGVCKEWDSQFLLFAVPLAKTQVDAHSVAPCTFISPHDDKIITQ